MDDYEVLWEDEIDGEKWRAICWWDENVEKEGEEDKGDWQFRLQAYIITSPYSPVKREWLAQSRNISRDVIEAILSDLSFWKRAYAVRVIEDYVNLTLDKSC